MFRFSKKGVYAVEAVLRIAGASVHQPLQARTLSERLGVPRRYLEPVLQELVRLRIIRGVRGPRGGYVLARPAETILVRDILDVVQMLEHSGDDDSFTGRETTAGALAAPLLDDLAKRLDHLFSSRSIADLAQPIAASASLRVAG
ncbi:MAG: RrF2 family transcriptional regulator [Rhodothalassiaceae bacterium]